MANPKSFESCIQQFYQSEEDWVDLKIDCGLKKQSRPQTSIIDDYISTDVALKAAKLTESIRNDLDGSSSHDVFGSFFHDLSGWDIGNTTESLNDTSALSYLHYSDKKDEGFHSGSVQNVLKKKCKKSQAIKALLALGKKPSTASHIGYRSKNDWGAEDDSSPRPYALDIPGSNQQVEEEEEEDELLIQQDVSKKPDTPSYPEQRDLDQELKQIIEATKAKKISIVQKPSSSFGVRRAVSSKQRPVFHQQTYFSTVGEKKSEKITITGKKYHNSDLSSASDTRLDRPSSAIQCDSTSLPIISHQTKKTCPLVQQNFKKEIVAQTNIFSKKDSGIEIPKWYNDSGTKPTNDQNLIRLMEIMGSKSTLRSPRKLTSNGFQSLPMPNKPPETRGFVFDKKPRGLNTMLDEVMKEDQELKVDVLKVPVSSSNQRSFAEEVQLNREAKANRKIKH